MMKKLFFIVPLLASQLIFAGENLVKNPGFEKKTDIPPKGCRMNFAESWIIYLNSGAAYCDASLADDKVEGEKSLKLEIVSEADKKRHAAAQQKMELDPAKSYKLTFFYKTVDGGHAFLTLVYLNEKGERIRRKFHVLPDTKGEWRIYSKNIGSSRKCVLDLGLGNLSKSRGAVFYDKVSVVGSEKKAPKKKKKTKKKTLTYNFDNMVLGDEWSAIGGGWTIKDAMLTAQGPGKLMLLKPLPKNVRVEYDCTSTSPCDISAFLYASKKGRKGVFFGFGSKNNTETSLRIGKQTIATDTKHLIKQAQQQHVVVEKAGSFLRMTIDGETVFNNRVPNIPQGKYFGFYVYGTAQIDNLKITPLSEKNTKLTEPPTRTNTFANFEDGKMPKWLKKTLGNEKSISIADRYNWRGKAIKDNSLIMRGGSEISMNADELESGLLELDIMGLSEGGEPATISLVDDKGQSLAKIALGEQGISVYDGTKWKKTTPKIKFPHHYDYAEIKLIPNEWFTLRIDFDSTKGEFDLAFLNYYYWPGDSPCNIWNNMPIGSNIPMKKGKVASVKISCGKNSYFCLDNISIYGPCNPILLKGKDKRISIRKTLKLPYTPRRNPFSLRATGFRYYDRLRPGRVPKTHRRANKGVPSESDGMLYSEICVKQAILADKTDILERAAFYSRKTANPAPNQAAGIADLLKKSKKTYSQLDDLYELYATAYIGKTSPSAFKTRFPRMAKRLRKNIASLLAKIARMTKKLATSNPTIIKNLPKCAAGRSAKNYVWKNGSYWSRGKQAYLFPEVYSPAFTKYLRFRPILDLQGCWRYVLKTYGNDPEKYVNVFSSINGMKIFSKINDDYTYQWSLNHGAHSLRMAVPPLWAEKHGVDKDIYIRDENGKIAGMPENKKYYKRGSSGPIAHLNYWHPEVRKMLSKMYAQAATGMRKNYPNRIKDIQFGGEMHHTVFGTKTGYGPAALAAFKKYLRGIYGTIDKLNSAWNSNYASFDAIKQPSIHQKGFSGLNYEFNRFRHKGYFEDHARIIREFRGHHPGVSASVNQNQPFWGGDCDGGFDVVEAFKTYDLIECHAFRKEWTADFRLLDSLAKAYGKRIGFQEMCSGPGAVLDSEVAKNFRLAYNLGFMAWGCENIAQWYGLVIGWDPQPLWLDHTLGFSVVDYAATALPLTFARVRRMGYAALNYPTIQPDVAILEVTSSFYNPPPQGYRLGVRAWMGGAAKELDAAKWNFGYLFESPLKEKKQKLDGTQSIVIPAAFCCPPWLQTKLASFAENGGTLIMLGPCGVYDQYGKPSGILLSKAFPGTKWSYDVKTMNWTTENEGSLAKKSRENGYIAESALGEGKVFLLNSMAKFDRTAFEKIVDENTKRTVSWTSKDDKIKTVFRSDGDRMFIYITNFDLRNRRETTIQTTKRFTQAADIGGETPITVPVKESKNAGTTFSVSLGPAETTLVELR